LAKKITGQPANQRLSRKGRDTGVYTYDNSRAILLSQYQTDNKIITETQYNKVMQNFAALNCCYCVNQDFRNR